MWYRLLIAAIAIFIYIRFKKLDARVTTKQMLYLFGIGAIIGLHWFTFYQSIKVSNVAIALSTLSMFYLHQSLNRSFLNEKLKFSKLFWPYRLFLCGNDF